MGMFGIIVMVIENELSSAGVYRKVSRFEKRKANSDAIDELTKVWKREKLGEKEREAPQCRKCPSST